MILQLSSLGQFTIPLFLFSYTFINTSFFTLFLFSHTFKYFNCLYIIVIHLKHPYFLSIIKVHYSMSLVDQNFNSLLANLWHTNNSHLIKGGNNFYKIDQSKLLGRGGFGMVFSGLCQTSQQINKEEKQISKYSYRQVAIKQFKNSHQWKNFEDKNKQIILFDKYGKLLSKQFVLQVIDNFQQTKTKKHLLVTPFARGGTLKQNIGKLKDEKQIYKLCIRLASILKYIHYDALAKFRAKRKVFGGSDQQKIGIIHRDVKPQNIVFLKEADVDSIYLVEFGIAKIAYSDTLKGYSDCGTSYYKSYQIQEGKIYNTKVDIYSFACTLFEVLNDGQRLMTRQGLSKTSEDSYKFIKGRLTDLEHKLLRKRFNSYYWIDLLHHCLAYETNDRYSSQQLLDHLQKDPITIGNQQNKFYFGLKQLRQTSRQKKDEFVLNYQIFRLNIIQDTLYNIFQKLYFENFKVDKFLLNTVTKFITMAFLDRLSRIKQKCQQAGRLEQLTHLIEDKRIADLSKKSHEKILKQIQKQQQYCLIKKRDNQLAPIKSFINQYPQILKEKLSDPKKILSEIVYQKRNVILGNLSFAKSILSIIYYLQDMDYYYKELRFSPQELDISHVDSITVKKLHYLTKSIEKTLSKEPLHDLFVQCRMEESLSLGFNKQDQKDDIEIEIIP